MLENDVIGRKILDSCSNPPGNLSAFRCTKHKVVLFGLAVVVFLLFSIKHTFSQDEKPADTTKSATGVIEIGEKFCDVEIGDGKIFLRNLTVNGQVVDFENKITIKQADMDNLQIIYMKKSNAIYLLGDHGFYYIQLTVKGKKVTSSVRSTTIPEKVNSDVLINSTKDILLFTTQKYLAVFKVGEWPVQTYAHDGSSFFTYPEAFYADATGVFVATTPTTLFVKTKRELAIIRKYSDMFQGMTKLVNPTFTINKYSEVVELRDKTLVTPKGQDVVINIPLNELDSITATREN